MCNVQDMWIGPTKWSWSYLKLAAWCCLTCRSIEVQVQTHMAAPVIAIAAGHSHSVALTKAGGIAHPSPPIPTLITDPCYVMLCFFAGRSGHCNLPGSKIFCTLCMIFCGTWNKKNVNDVFCSRWWKKVSSTAPGEVLTWGANDQGQLGNARDWEVGPQTSNFWSMIRVLGCRDAESECEEWKGPRNGFKSDSKLIQTCQNSTQI